MTDYPSSAKAATKLRRTIDALRRMIVSGQLKPGDQLPTRAEISVQFDLAPSLAQMVTAHLRRERYVESRPPLGMFVAAHPPHMNRFALIQPYDPREHEAGLYWQAISAAARGIDADATPRRFVVAEAVDGHADREQYRMLLADLEQDRLAGLIFSDTPFHLAQTPLLEHPGVPRVAMGGSPYPGMPVVVEDLGRFVRRAVGRLVSRGRQRLAVVAGYAGAASQIGGPELDQALAVHGLSLPPYWRLALNPLEPGGVRGVAHLLFMGVNGQRPDGVIVLDDNLLDVVLAGMVDAGLRSPDDVDVVSMVNYPLVRPSLMPVHRLGFDTGAMLDIAVDLILAQRRGQAAPPLTMLPPLFDEERSVPSSPRFTTTPAIPSAASSLL